MHYYTHTELEGSPRRYHANNSMAGPWISYEAIKQAVADAIMKERNVAEQVKRRMESDVGQFWIESKKQEISEKAKKVFEQMYRQLQAAITAQEVNTSIAEKQSLERLEMDSCQLEDENKQLEMLYEPKNPWLLRYTQRPWPVELDNKDIRHWIEDIKVFQLQKVIVTLKDQEWREKLPLEWMEGIGDGKKKQA